MTNETGMHLSINPQKSGNKKRELLFRSTELISRPEGILKSPTKWAYPSKISEVYLLLNTMIQLYVGNWK
jgi:hypothetical protein